MPVTVTKNERSWAIELIHQINQFVSCNDLVIRHAGGEATISTGKSHKMFPDVILYGSQAQQVILQGWELKMPDVPIEDEAFVHDAQRKADALHLNSCVIWNFTYAVLYVREGDHFTALQQWNDTAHIRTREDVETYQNDWKRLLEKVLLAVNQYFIDGSCQAPTLIDTISTTSFSMLIQRNQKEVAEHLKQDTIKDTVFDAKIKQWWQLTQAEYAGDEVDPFHAYAKSLILNWTVRIFFAHYIKRTQNGSRLIDQLTYSTTPSEAETIFKKITARCDFFHIFSPFLYSEHLPATTWHDLVEFSVFLQNNPLDHLPHEVLQNALESTVNTTKREINGQFSTPPELAKLLVQLTVRNWDSNLLDCCCGTGTIAKAALQTKKDKVGPQRAVETVWCCDKNQYPLQIANLSLADHDTMNLANRIFLHNALSLAQDEKITIVDPRTGLPQDYSLPAFGTIVSNLPFVPFESIPADDREWISKSDLFNKFDPRSDLYCYIAEKVSELLEPNGMLGIITSNSWTGTAAGRSFISILLHTYDLLQVHISGKGRWFHNADVVTTILILKKRSDPHRIPGDTQFFVWHKTLDELTANPEWEFALVQSALLGEPLYPDIVSVSTYSQARICALQDLHVSYNALFYDIAWLTQVQGKMIPIYKVFHVFRGSRRGWNPLFYPEKGTHGIEMEYLKPFLHNGRKVHRLGATADGFAFCCEDSIEVLQKKKKTGALNWIRRFENQTNKVGEPLPQVLHRTGMHWYELQTNEIADLFTIMNPDQRFFFSRFDTPSFIDQRLIGLNFIPDYPDKELNHALINSIFTLFYLEASGFGRGLGVLDINKTSVANCYMLDPGQVSTSDRALILAAFAKIKDRNILPITEELRDPDRLDFERTVFRCFGIENLLPKVIHSFRTLHQARTAVKL